MDTNINAWGLGYSDSIALVARVRELEEENNRLKSGPVVSLSLRLAFCAQLADDLIAEYDSISGKSQKIKEIACRIKKHSIRGIRENA